MLKAYICFYEREVKAVESYNRCHGHVDIVYFEPVRTGKQVHQGLDHSYGFVNGMDSAEIMMNRWSGLRVEFNRAEPVQTTLV